MKTSWKKLVLDWLYLIRYSWSVSRQVFPAMLIQVLLDAAEPFPVLILSQVLIDELAGPARWGIVLRCILLIIGAMTLLKVIRMVSTYFMIGTWIHRGDMQTKGDYAESFLNMDYARLEDGKVRDLQRRVSSQVHPTLVVYVCLGGMLTGLFQLAGYSYLIAGLHPVVLFLVFAVAGVNYYLGIRAEKGRDHFRTVHAAADRKFDYLFRTMIDFRYAGEVRINQMSGWLSGKFMKVWEEYRVDRRGYDRGQIRIRLAACVTDLFQMLAMYGYAVYQAFKGMITVGNFSMYVGAILNFSGAFRSFAEGLSRMAFMDKYADEHKEYIRLAVPSHREKGIERISGEEQGHVFEFRDVSFRYPNTERLILNRLSLVITDHEKLAIVGRNGTGKTTFIKLLCRLYEPTGGKILYNGVDISTIHYGDYIKLLSTVFQDFRLFAFPVRENIVLNQAYDGERLEWAIGRAGLAARLGALPHGAETAVSKEFDEEGVEFSGGEAQKLVTARAYYKDAPAVLLDEPTSALDAIAEQEMYEQFGEIMEGKAAIFISHRLASTRFCDRIVVLEDGEVREYGSHDALMEQKGLYYEMFCRQAEYYREEGNA